MASVEAQIRKYRKNLTIAGAGTILFGLWQCMKIWILMIWNRHRIDAFLMDVENEAPSRFESTLFMIITLCIYLLFFVINLFIGVKAIRCGKDGKSSIILLLVTAAYFILSVIGLPYYFTSQEDAVISDTSFAAFLVELTFTLTLFEIVYSAIKISLLEKKERQG